MLTLYTIYIEIFKWLNFLKMLAMAFSNFENSIFENGVKGLASSLLSLFFNHFETLFLKSSHTFQIFRNFGHSKISTYTVD